MVEGDLNTGLAKSIKQFLFGGVLKESNWYGRTFTLGWY
jgi:hypothetical protein